MKQIIYYFLILSVSYCEWSTNIDNPLELGFGIQSQIKSTSDGGAYVAWLSEVNFNVHIQKLDQYGNLQFEENGLIVSAQPNSSWIAVHHMNLVVDDDDNAIVSTLDTRTGQWQVYVYKISPDGEMLWGNDGIHVSILATENISPRVELLSNNDVIITWCENYVSVRIQKISSNGEIQWNEGGIHIVDNTGDLLNPIPIKVDNENFFIQWNHQSGPFWAPDTKLFIQKYDNYGNEMWPSPIIAVGPEQFPTGDYFQEIITNQYGGVYNAWTQMTLSNQSAIVQNISSDGEIIWDNGVELSLNNNHFRMHPQIDLSLDSENFLSAWTESNSSQSQRGIYAQKINQYGQKQWQNTGIAIVDLNSDYSYLDLDVKVINNDMYAVYIQQSNNMNGDILASRLDIDGIYVWNEHNIHLTNSNNPKSDLFLEKNQTCLFVSWSEQDRIKIHRLRLDGTVGGNQNILGDVNQDFIIDILDIVQLVQIALGYLQPNSNADLNDDQIYNIQDIILLIDIILQN